MAIEINSDNIIAGNHMALLRNLRNIENAKVSDYHMDKVAVALIKGVKNGKQFPFRYYTAFNNVSSKKFKDALEKCIDESMVNFPVLQGKTMCLSDNSGSAWGAFTSEYGSVTIAEIGNLSSIMTAINSDEGYVGIFGDDLRIHKTTGKVFDDLKSISPLASKIGGSTENGIWLFWDNAIKNKEHWDNVFIYSDQQAGHGGLYGKNSNDYKDHLVNGRYINVISLVNKYRKEVNNDVNVFSVQTAGYDNTILPETNYRTAILAGWTGKEVIYANELINIWNSER